MSIKNQTAVAATVLLLFGRELVAQQARNSAAPPSTSCKHCDRPTPFGQTQGLSVVIMVRDGFAKSTIDAVIRDEPGVGRPPLIALKRSAITPALVYRALASLSEDRVKHSGPPPARATTVLSAGSAFEAVPDEDSAWVAKLIAQLSAAPTTNIAGVGSFPAVTFTIDKKALRGK